MEKVFSKVVAALAVLGIIGVVGFLPIKQKLEQEQEVLSKFEEKTFKTGFALSPKSSQEKDFLDFFERVKANSEVLLWVGKLDNQTSGQLISLSNSFGYIPVIITDLDDSQLILDFVAKTKPAYLGIGDEINRGTKENVESFAEEFGKIYSEIKRVSPDTKVFPTLQLEIVKGLRGGEAQWDLLPRFQDADLLAFTTYPSVVFQTPSEIPENYFSEVSTYTEKTIAFSEVGWPSSTSEGEQAEFIRKFKEGVEESDPEFVIWTFMYDQNVQKPFDTMGLIARDGKEREGWKAWIEN